MPAASPSNLPAALRRDVVVVGASAGGLEVLRAIAAGLPRGLEASVFVVMHIGSGRSELATILGRDSALPVAPGRGPAAAAQRVTGVGEGSAGDAGSSTGSPGVSASIGCPCMHRHFSTTCPSGRIS